MIVVDASAMVEALVGRWPGEELLESLTKDLHAPQHLDVEVTSALRGLVLGKVIPQERAITAIHDYFQFSIYRHPLEPIVTRVWDLRHQFTTYDACYLALAEALDAPFITCDIKMLSAVHGADVRVVARTI